MVTRTSQRVVAMVMLAACAGCRSTTNVERSAGEIFRLDRAGFVQELVFAYATPRTMSFEDGTDGSYHVNKLDLVQGIRERKLAGTPILAAVVTGPVGPLWAYEAKLMVREGEGIRVNTVWMPHARITEKSTALISASEFEELVRAIEDCDALVSDAPDGPPRDEWSYDLLAILWVADTERIYSSTAVHWLGADLPTCLIRVHDTMKNASTNVVTYSSDISEEESIYLPQQAPP